MTGATRGRRRDGGTFTHARRTPIVTLLAWASLALVSAALARVSAEGSTPFVEEHLSTRVKSRHSTKSLCWETQGLHERDCFHEHPLPEETYPLTLEMLERASSRYTASDLSLHRAFQRARKRGELKIVVVGGSVTAGFGCVSPAGLTEKECAWSHRLKQWCDENIQDFTVEVINAAMPGCSIQTLLRKYLDDAFPVDVEVDLIIVDFGVNDAVMELIKDGTNNVKIAHEVFIRYVRNEMIDRPALLYAESFISGPRVRQAPSQAGNMAEVHAAVTMKYDIPMASFRDAVWPDLADSSVADRIWGAPVHPDWQVHQLFADVLVYYIQKSYARFLGEHGLLSSPSLEEKAVSRVETTLGCKMDVNAFVLDPRSFVGLPPPAQQVKSVGWSFAEDQEGQPGLLGYGNSSIQSTVSFDLPCAGERRLLNIDYLRGHTGLGAVYVVVSGSGTEPDDEADDQSIDEGVIVLDGLWERKSSTIEYVVLSTPNDSDIIRVTFEIMSAETEPNHDRPPSDDANGESDNIRLDRKFKVERLQCC